MKKVFRKLRKGPTAVAAIIVLVLMALLMRACSSVSALDTPVNDTEVSVTNPNEIATTAPTQPTVAPTQPTEPTTEPSITATEPTEPEEVTNPTVPTEPEVEAPEVTIPTEPEISDDTNVPEEPEVPEEKHEHSYNTDVVVATCTTDGYTVYECECGDSYTADVVPAFGHKYESTPVVPTCTNGGYTINVCGECGDRHVDNYVPATGHSYGDWVVDQEATCTESGVEVRGCACCAVESREIEATGHNYNSVITNPTCTDSGYTTHTCSNCSNSYKDSEVDALGHHYEFAVTEPTCTEKGYTTNTCSNCNHVYVSEVVKELGHSFTNYKSNSDATCAEDGTKTAKCDNGCGEKKTVTDNGSALGHNYDAVVTNPTCTKNGYTTYTCSTCGHGYVGDSVKAYGHKWQAATCTTAKICTTCGTTEGEIAGHDYESVVTTPTCTERGYTTYTCHCGNNYIDNYVNANGHEMGEWKTVTRSSCTGNGKEARYCTNCDHSETRVVEGTGHNYVSEVVAPTYESEGYTIHTCSNCGDTYKDNYVDALVPEEEEEDCGEHKGCCGYHDAHRHIEVKIGKYLYVYCDHVTSIYRSADGLIIFYPYELYN